MYQLAPISADPTYEFELKELNCIFIQKNLFNQKMIEESFTKPKPFLRWAGGKSWLIRRFEVLFPNLQFNRYHEPFLGGAALFFYLQPKEAVLSDLNPKLIETYKCLKTDVETVIKELKRFKNDAETYYKVRSAQFNSPFKKAAQFIYLNQTSFNGIYRENLSGVYNVPYGYRTKSVVDTTNLRAVSRSLKTSKLFDRDFTITANEVGKDDLVFLDPPYTVTHNNNGFIKYNQKLFSLEDQLKLSKTIDLIKSKKAKFILTNAAHDAIREIFIKSDDRVIELSRASLIGGKNANRGSYSELLITNIF